MRTSKMHITLLGLLLLSTGIFAQQQPSLIIKLRGIAVTNITVTPVQTGGTALPAVAIKVGAANGETVRLNIDKSALPGEFVVRYDYKVKPTDNPYPAEQTIIIGTQPVEMSVSPVYSNNKDSVFFNSNETENTLLARFRKDNAAKRQPLTALQGFLLGYDDKSTALYTNGQSTYEQRRNNYNEWLQQLTKLNKNSFASNAFGFERIAVMDFNATDSVKLRNAITHYFDGVDLSSSTIVRSSQLSKFIDGYVKMNAQFLKKDSQRDSLFTAIAIAAMEKAKAGSPEVYGFMADYFYRGFEKNAMSEPMKALEPYISDPRCLTADRQQINIRLAGLKSLAIGTAAPNFELVDSSTGKTTAFKDYTAGGKYKLLLFWSASCSHCTDLAAQLYPYSNQPSIKGLVDVVAFSIDESPFEIGLWKTKEAEMPSWRHQRGNHGLSSKAAQQYFVLSTPTMVLVDANTNKIAALPTTFAELKNKLDTL